MVARSVCAKCRMGYLRVDGVVGRRPAFLTRVGGRPGEFSRPRRFGGISGTEGSGAVEHCAQGFALVGGVVAVGLRLVAESAAQLDDGDSGVGEAGEIARQLAVAHSGAVLVVGEVADVVDTVLDFPVAAIERENFGRSGPLWF